MEQILETSFHPMSQTALFDYKNLNLLPDFASLGWNVKCLLKKTNCYLSVDRQEGSDIGAILFMDR